MIAIVMNTHVRDDHTGANHAYFLDAESYDSVTVSPAWDNPQTSSASSSRNWRDIPTWAGTDLPRDDASRHNMPAYSLSASNFQRPDPMNSLSSDISQDGSSVNAYLQSWPYENNGYTEGVTSQPYPRSVPVQANLDENTHIEPQASYRRDSDSQLSQITSANDSIASSLQEPAPSQPSRPNNRTSPPAESRRPKTWSTRPHSIIEKKYRENLNNKIWQLHQTLVETNRLAGLKGTQQHMAKISKSEIIANAIRYVNEMELNSRHMEEQIARLMEKVESLGGDAGEERSVDDESME